jgi:glucosylceramidase
MVDQFRLEPNVLKSYARYFAKYVEEYAKEGIKIWAVMPQNEPNSSQNFPSCVWRPESLALFVGRYLGPEFAARKLKTQIWLGTIERPQMERCDTMMSDPDLARYISGAGFQWAGMDVLPLVHKKYPNLRLMQTETMCGDGSNDWNSGVATFRQISRNIKNGANAYMYWNLILDEGGVSRWGWRQNAPVIVNPKTLGVTYTAEYWAMKHFSKFVPPGSRLLSATGYADAIAFQRPDKKIAVVCVNASNEYKTIGIAAKGKKYRISMEPDSFFSAMF